MKLSIVATLYHSEAYIFEFYNRCRAAILPITSDYEFIFVNDGSPDNSREEVLEIQKNDSNVVLIDLSRNFGHHKAMFTGLKFTTGDFIYLIDTDLEEEPESVTQLFSEMNSASGVDVVYGIQPSRKGGLMERLSGKLFYTVFHLLAELPYPADTLTCRIMTRNYVNNVLAFNEKNLDIWGIFELAGFRQKGILIKKGHKGTSTYTFTKKLRHAIDSITSLSHKPLYLVFLLGLIMVIGSFLASMFVLYRKLVHATDVEGWTSLMLSVWFVGGIILFVLGIISIYLSKIFIEIKNRPLTVVRGVYRINNE
jgi:putative glycosyltransferase